MPSLFTLCFSWLLATAPAHAEQPDYDDLDELEDEEEQRLDDEDELEDEDGLSPARVSLRQELARIHRAAGLGGHAPPLYESHAVRARAEERGGRTVILVSPAFLARMDRRARTRWASTFILAHELGHHVHGHAFREGPVHEEELEADRFAARTLRAMGATLTETQAGLRAAPEPASETHPGTDERLRVIEEAYLAPVH